MTAIKKPSTYKTHPLINISKEMNLNLAILIPATSSLTSAASPCSELHISISPIFIISFEALLILSAILVTPSTRLSIAVILIPATSISGGPIKPGRAEALHGRDNASRIAKTVFRNFCIMLSFFRCIISPSSDSRSSGKSFADVKSDA